MRDYGKVHSTFWSSDTIRGLSDNGKLLALYLMTSTHCTIAGVYRLPDGYACDDLQWTDDDVHETLSELFLNGFATRCDTTKWVWIRKFLDWNKPDNPNQRKAVAKVAAGIPENCVWLPVFLAEQGVAAGLPPVRGANPSETVWERLPNPFETRNRNRRQEQDQKKGPIQVGTEPSVSTRPAVVA